VLERIVFELDGGVGDILVVYEDRVIIKHKGALNFLAMGMQGDKTLYYCDITSVQYKKPSWIAGGYLQFSLPGGRESVGGLFAASSDENTITLSNSSKVVQLAEKVAEYINAKIRDDKKNIGTVQQLSSADELKKFKELLDSGIITQEEFNIKKKELLGI